MDQGRRCTAIVVSYNSAEELPDCLRSLEAQRDVSLDIRVVDNASTDGSAALVRERFPRAHLEANARNVGFARANNQVLERARAPYFALVNPDTVLPPDAVARCVAFLEANPEAALAGTRLVDRDGRLQPSCHAFLGLANLAGETFLLDRAFPGLAAVSSLRMPGFAHDRVAEVGWIPGAFLVVRGAVVRQIGGFDPDFFMYAEEMDWCYRIRGAGWKVVFLPEPAVVHLGGASSRPIAGPMFVENLKGRVRFLRKHRGPLVALVARLLIAVSVLLRWGTREVQALGLRLAGRASPEPLVLRQVMFRAALRWVLRGLPMSPPELGETRGGTKTAADFP